MIKKFFLWLVASSQDPSKLSLTVKGLMLTAVPAITFFSGFQYFHVLTTVTPDIYNVLISYVVTFINDAFGAIGAALAIYGLIRKLFTTHVAPAAIAALPAPVVSATVIVEKKVEPAPTI